MYIGDSDSHIIHFSTCKYANEISNKHRVSFSSTGQARANGYRSCKVCNPY